MEMVDIEVWAVVDQDGDYAVAADPDNLGQAYKDEIGGDLHELASRRIKIVVKVPRPKPAEVVATLGDEPAAAEVQAA